MCRDIELNRWSHEAVVTDFNFCCVQKDAVVIDVGINRVDDDTREKGYRIVGDVDFEAVKEIASAISPVPGGVGRVTISMLMKSTVQAAENSLGQ